MPPLLRFVVAHGRGLCAPAFGFWLLVALPWLVGLLLIDTLTSWIHIRGGWLVAAAWGWLIAVAAWPLWLAWAIGGTWRALRRQARTDPGPAATRRRWVVRAGLAGFAGLTLAAALTSQWPRLADRLELAFGGDPLGRLQATLSLDGERLQLRGPIGAGDAERIRRLADAVLTLQWVELQSPGGRQHEAERLAALARERGWTVRVVGRCANACVTLLAGGRSRQVLPPAQLALQRVDTPAFLPGFGLLAAQWQQQAWQRAGLAPQALYKAMASLEPLWWLVDGDELVPGGFVSRHERPLDVDLPARTDAPAEHYAEMFAVNPTWHALAKRRPDLLNEAAARMRSARMHGFDTDVVQAAAQQLVDTLAPTLAREASSERQLERLQLLDEQLAAAAPIGEAACRGVREGMVMPRRVLPPALAVKEAAWLQRAALEQRVHSPRPLAPLEREMLRRALGAHTLHRLGVLWYPVSAGELDCAASRALIARTLALPPNELRMALRAMFVR